MNHQETNINKAGIILLLAVVVIASSSLTTAVSVQTQPGFNSVKTSASCPAGRPEEEIKYYDPESLLNVIGVGAVMKWQSAIRLTQEELSPYTGWTLTKVNAGYSADNGQDQCDATVIIYGEGDETHPGAVLQNDTTYHFDSSGVTTIPLVTPLVLGSYNELWISIEWYQTDVSVYLALMDAGPAVDGKGDWGFDGNWSELQIYDLDYNWAIGAIVEGEGNAQLTIGNVVGPKGISADIKNVGVSPAHNLVWSITATGGLLKHVNKTASGTSTELAVNVTQTGSTGMFLGLGKIYIAITASADNAEKVTVTKTAFLLGPFVFKIQ